MPRKATTPPPAPYHHGDLRHALIEASESLLAERGPDGFSLREVARRAGVSPAAPAHHFGDAAGLLTAVVTLAFEGLAQALREGDERGGDDPRARLREQGVEYVRFALRHPGRFRLMFRGGMLHADSALEHHAEAAFGLLAAGVRRAFGLGPDDALQAAHWTALLALWSVVHGYAHLVTAGRFDRLAGDAGRQAFVDHSLRPVLDGVLAGVVGDTADDTPPPRRRSRR